MSNETMDKQKMTTTSLASRFRRSIIWLYIATVIVTIPITYFITKYQIYAEANKELSLLVDMVASVREYIAKDVRQDLLDAKLFQSPAISGTVTTSFVANHFLKKQPEYYIKIVSDNPINKMNLPEPQRSQLCRPDRPAGFHTGRSSTIRSASEYRFARLTVRCNWP